MPPESRQTARPLRADRKPAGARQLLHVHVGVALVQLDAQLQIGPAQVHRQRGPALERCADLALQLLRGEREALVPPAHPDREAARAQALEGHQRRCRRSSRCRARRPGRPTRWRSRRRARAARRPARPSASPGTAILNTEPPSSTRASSPLIAAFTLRRRRSRNCRRLRPLSDASPTFARHADRQRRGSHCGAVRRALSVSSLGIRPSSIEMIIARYVSRESFASAPGLRSDRLDRSYDTHPFEANGRPARARPRSCSCATSRTGRTVDSVLPRARAHAAQEEATATTSCASASPTSRAACRRSAGKAPARRTSWRRSAPPCGSQGRFAVSKRFGAQLTIESLSWQVADERLRAGRPARRAARWTCAQMEADLRALVETVQQPAPAAAARRSLRRALRRLAPLPGSAGRQVLPPGLRARPARAHAARRAGRERGVGLRSPASTATWR